MKINYFITVVGVLQVVGGLWAAWGHDWKMAIINIAVGIANGTLSTMAK